MVFIKQAKGGWKHRNGIMKQTTLMSLIATLGKNQYFGAEVSGAKITLFFD